jgi:hypothetical protein
MLFVVGSFAAKNNRRFFVLFLALAKNKTIKQEQITKKPIIYFLLSALLAPTAYSWQLSICSCLSTCGA